MGPRGQPVGVGHCRALQGMKGNVVQDLPRIAGKAREIQSRMRHELPVAVRGSPSLWPPVDKHTRGPKASPC